MGGWSRNSVTPDSHTQKTPTPKAMTMRMTFILKAKKVKVSDFQPMFLVEKVRKAPEVQHKSLKCLKKLTRGHIFETCNREDAAKVHGIPCTLN